MRFQKYAGTMPPLPDSQRRLSAGKKPTGTIPILLQEWHDLLFLHWSMDASVIQAGLPEGLFVDTYDGQAFIGVVPFYMQGLRPIYCPAVPFVSSFPELNLRSYVYDRTGRPGVWFFSLDAASWMSVQIARCFFALNYQYAKMRYDQHASGAITLSAQRKNQSWQRFEYAPFGAEFRAKAGSLEHFLVERYHLFVQNKRGQLCVGTIHHAPYKLQPVALERYSTDLFQLNGFNAADGPPVHQCYSRRTQVRIYPMQVV